MHHAQTHNSKIAHRAGSGTDIKSIARRDQNNTQTVEFVRSGQEQLF
jgi:hypothetical protein